jgi:hypothetical protein
MKKVMIPTLHHQFRNQHRDLTIGILFLDIKDIFYNRCDDVTSAAGPTLSPRSSDNFNGGPSRRSIIDVAFLAKKLTARKAYEEAQGAMCKRNVTRDVLRKSAERIGPNLTYSDVILGYDRCGRCGTGDHDRQCNSECRTAAEFA